MRKFLLLFLLLSAAGIAQTFDFEGKTYMVYPIVLEEDKESKVSEEDSVWKAQTGFDFATSRSSEKTSIPPVYQKLTDGAYVMLQKSGSSNKVRATFTVQNAVINGYAKLYSGDGKIESEGQYINNIQEGIWKEWKHESDCVFANEYTYVLGEKKGVFKEFRCVNKQVYLEQEGENEGYLSKGKVTLYDVDTLGRVYLRAEYYARNSYVINYYREYYPSGKLKAEISKKTFDSLDYIDLHSASSSFAYEEDFEFANHKNISILSNLYYVPKKGKLQYYHENGRKVGSISFGNTDFFNYDVKFDTLWNDKGGIYALQYAIADTLEKKRELFQLFDTNGNLESKTYSVKSLGNEETYQEYEAWKRSADGQMEISFADYFILHGTKDFSQSNNDTLLLLKAWKKGDYYTYTYFSPRLNGAEFVKMKNKWVTADFKISLFDPNNFAFETVVKLGDLKVVVYTRSDKSVNAKLRKSASQFHGFFDKSQNDLGYRLDSMIIYYKEKPFSGTLALVYSEEDFMFRKEKKTLFFNIKSLYEKKQMDRLKIDGEKTRIDFTVEKGMLSMLDGKFETSMASVKIKTAFKNSLPDGKLLAEISSPFFKKGLPVNLKVESNLVEGMPHGKTIVWNKNSDAQDFCLQKVENFYYGNYRDTAYSYYPDCSLSKIEVYDEDAKRHGVQVKFFREDEITEYSSYNHGIKEGPSFKLKGADTLSYINIQNNVLDGLSMQKSYVDGRALISKCYYKEGRIAANIKVVDERGNLRMEIKVDSSFGKSDAEIESKNPLTSWEYNYTVAGEVKIYYPNGNLYSEGRMGYEIFHSTSPKGTYYYSASMVQASEDTVVASAHSILEGKWKYYHTNGKVMCEVSYNKWGSINYIKEYYANGKLKCEGEVLAGGIAGECENELPVLDLDIDYKSYFKEDGTPVLKNGNGSIKYFYNNGVLKYEVTYLKGERNGWFKKYNKEGHLVLVGKYVNGNKDGRWLEGDLEGINYLDDKCFESLEAAEAYEAEEKNNLEVSESIYNKGALLHSKSYTFKRSLK